MKKLTKLVATTITTFSSDVDATFEKAPQKSKVTRNEDICGELLGMDSLFEAALQRVSEPAQPEGSQDQFEQLPEMVLMDRTEMSDQLLGNQFQL